MACVPMGLSMTPLGAAPALERFGLDDGQASFQVTCSFSSGSFFAARRASFLISSLQQSIPFSVSMRRIRFNRVTTTTMPPPFGECAGGEAGSCSTGVDREPFGVGQFENPGDLLDASGMDNGIGQKFHLRGVIAIADQILPFGGDVFGTDYFR